MKLSLCLGKNQRCNHHSSSNDNLPLDEPDMLHADKDQQDN